MKPLFAYKDWTPDPPAPDFDHPMNYSFADDEFGFAICPQPSCLNENFEPKGLNGPVAFEGACGEPTAIAVPCSDHRGFEFSTGWYLCMADRVPQHARE